MKVVDKVAKNNSLDKAGVWITGLCAVHCLSLPILLPLIPVFAGSFFAEEWFEHVILGLSIVLGFLALIISFYKYHRQLYPLYALAMGGLIYWQKDVFGHDFEPVIVIVGAILIIGSHILNIRLCKSCRDCDKSVTPTA